VAVYNLLTLLYLTYLLSLFTDIVDIEITLRAGDQFIYTTLTNIGLNLVVASLPILIILTYRIFIVPTIEEKTKYCKEV